MSSSSLPFPCCIASIHPSIPSARPRTLTLIQIQTLTQTLCIHAHILPSLYPRPPRSARPRSVRTSRGTSGSPFVAAAAGAYHRQRKWRRQHWQRRAAGKKISGSNSSLRRKMKRIMLKVPSLHWSRRRTQSMSFQVALARLLLVRCHSRISMPPLPPLPPPLVAGKMWTRTRTWTLTRAIRRLIGWGTGCWRLGYG